jgi:hypothetical protein
LFNQDSIYGGGISVALGSDLMLKLYRDMWVVRSFEFGLEAESSAEF